MIEPRGRDFGFIFKAKEADDKRSATKDRLRPSCMPFRRPERRGPAEARKRPAYGWGEQGTAKRLGKKSQQDSRPPKRVKSKSAREGEVARARSRRPVRRRSSRPRLPRDFLSAGSRSRAARLADFARQEERRSSTNIRCGVGPSAHPDPRRGAGRWLRAIYEEATKTTG